MAERHISTTSDFMNENEKKSWFKQKLLLDVSGDIKTTFPIRDRRWSS